MRKFYRILLHSLFLVGSVFTSSSLYFQGEVVVAHNEFQTLQTKTDDNSTIYTNENNQLFAFKNEVYYQLVFSSQKHLDAGTELTALNNEEYVFNSRFDDSESYRFLFSNADTYNALLSVSIQENNRRFMEYVSKRTPTFYTSIAGLATSEQAKEMHAFTSEITKHATTDSQRVKVVHDWITNNIYYDFDCYTQCSQSAYSVFSRRRGVCSGYSRLFTFMLRSINIPTINVIGLAGSFSSGDHTSDVSNSATNHEWNLVYFDGKWRIIDTTWNTGLSYDATKGYYVRFQPRWKYYDISSDLISQSHIFKSPLPPANIKVTNLTHNSLTLTWDKDEFSDGYRVISPVDNQDGWFWIISDNIDINQTQITLYLQPNKKNIFGVVSYKVKNGEKVSSSPYYIEIIAPFIDVPVSHRNYAHINTLVELGIINGYSDNTFRPNNTLTRAQAAIMIARAIGLSTEGVSSNFTDVPSTHSAYKFISAAQNAGIINGYSDGTFKPNASITRAQIAVMVQRAFQIQTSGTAVSFGDVPVGYGPKTFIETLASQKIVNGYSDGTFKPTNNVTRAQFSTMINNAIEYSKKK